MVPLIGFIYHRELVLFLCGMPGKVCCEPDNILYYASWIVVDEQVLFYEIQDPHIKIYRPVGSLACSTIISNCKFIAGYFHTLQNKWLGDALLS